ncbi:hypothetical protein QJQ45_025576, partial [Haematococcus lacustris]
ANRLFPVSCRLMHTQPALPNRTGSRRVLPQHSHRPCTNVPCSPSDARAVHLRNVAAAVDIQALHVAFGSGNLRRMVLQGVDLRIHRGTLHMILGPNGCGKSTLLKVLGGLVPATSGQVNMDLPTGFVFQNPDHQVIMPTVAADVAFGLGRYDLPADTVKQAVHQALRLVNMERFMSSGTHTLSGGQRQRVAIAGALAEGPRVLLLDELTTFLDMEDQFGVLAAVRSITRGEAPPPSAHLPPADPSLTGTPSPPGTYPATGASRGSVPAAAVRGPEGAGSSAGTKEHANAAGQAVSGAAGVAQGVREAGPTVGAAAGPVTAVWVTHRFEELEYADQASYMEEGRVVFTGSPQEMRAFLSSLGAPV